MKQMMLRCLVITVLLMAASLSIQAQTNDTKNERLTRELVGLQRAEVEAEDKKDVATLDRLLCEDFIFTAPGGTVIDKKKFIEEAKASEPETGQTIDYEETRTFDYGNTAVVNNVLVVRGRDQAEKDYVNRFRNTVVWVRQKGNWRMAAIHVSRIRP